METLLLYALCTASLFYLGSRAVITSWLWSRYPLKLGHFFDCSACSGTWYGALVGYVGGYHLGLSFLGLPGDRPETVAAVALCAMAFTPIAAGLVQAGFDKLGSAVTEPEEDPSEAEHTVPFVPVTADVAPTVYAEKTREVAGTIVTRDTPREIPSIRKITIPPKDE